MIVDFFEPGVDGRTSPALPAYVTMATRSSGRNCSTSSRRPACTSGSLSADCIDPEVSMRKTRLLGGRSRVLIRFPCRPISSRRCFPFQGQAASSVEMENGSDVGSG